MILLGLTLAAGLLIGVFILNGIKITKMFDGLTKSIINITKTTMVWAIGIIITLIGSS
jgi:Mg2+/citrate symporter